MEQNTVTPLNVTSGAILEHFGGFMTQVYGWMTLGLILTALSAFVARYTIFGLELITNPIVFFVLLIVELFIVIGLSAAAQRMPVLIAGGLFLLYSVINGLFLSGLLANFTTSSVAQAFVVSAGTFMVMSIYGLVSKSDLTRWGNLAIMGLFGVLIGLVVNIFWQSDAFGWLLTFVGIAVFLGLIAYDTQKLKQYAQMADGSRSGFAVRAALALYLDFINLFIRLVMIFGRRK